VECATCKRVYSLETGASETGGLRLMTYPVKFRGTKIIVDNTSN
jgi:nitrite reductase/ring-hydroxylating ferredoxin subunit